MSRGLGDVYKRQDKSRSKIVSFLMKIFPLYFPAGESALAKKMPGLEKVRERREKETTALVSH